MGDVEIPIWLKGLPLAPEFRPTDTEFADPIAYISKIEKEASAFGICKVIPPFSKPSKKYVLSNLNQSLLKCPELGSDVISSAGCSATRMGSGDKENDGEVRAVFTTRHQELGQNMKRPKGPQSAVHKQVWQSGEVYTFLQFEAKSKAFARNYLGMVKEISPLVIEALFWKAASEKPIYVEYANDVPGSGFGEPQEPFRYFRGRRRRRRKFNRNGQISHNYENHRVDILASSCNNSRKEVSVKDDKNPDWETSKSSPSSPALVSDEGSSLSWPKSSNASDDREGTAGWKLSNSPWNLQVIARSHGSLTRFMPDEIPGVTSPMVYIGMLFSWFAWHVEDHELHSLNFLHTGSPKTWYAVPGDYAFAFEEVVRAQAYGGHLDRLAALALLGEKTTLLSPEVVVDLGIPCCRLVQNPGEFVVTFPRAYHVGFGHGFSCGEAANFGTPQWLKVAKEAAVRRAAMNYLPMLSHQQLLYMLTMSFISRVPRSLLPGARSSRLRDRQKEERELLVKKAFIDDMLNENSLLSVLLGKESTSYAVLWDPDSLSSPSKESQLYPTSTSPDAFCSLVEKANMEICSPEKRTSCIENVLHNESDIFATTSRRSISYFDSKKDESHNYLFDQARLCMETVGDMYADDDDLPCGLQIDSGTLGCVACGILGFPFMSIVQPSVKALRELFPAECPLVQEGLGNSGAVKSHAPPDILDIVEPSTSGVEEEQDEIENGKLSSTCERHVPITGGPKPRRDVQLIANDNEESFSHSVLHSADDITSIPNLSQVPEVPESNSDKRWNTSNGFLRPRLFCLEHSVEIKELLLPKGGANVLVICHSDYEKIKAHAVAAAVEIGNPFKYRDVSLRNASREDLNLINVSIDDDREECGEDWTSKLGLNLRYCVKVRKIFPSKQEQHALILGGLFSDMIAGSNVLNLKWHGKRSRTRHKLTGASQIKPCINNIQVKNDDMLAQSSDGNKVKTENKIIQYSRRSFNSVAGGPAGVKRARGRPRKFLPKDEAVGNDGDVTCNTRDTSKDTPCGIEAVGSTSAGLAFSPALGKSPMLQEMPITEESWEMNMVSGSGQSAGSLSIAITGVENFEAQVENQICEANMDSKVCNLSTVDSSEMQNEIQREDRTGIVNKSLAVNPVGRHELQTENQTVKETNKEVADCSFININGCDMQHEVSEVSDHAKLTDSLSIELPICSSLELQRENAVIEKTSMEYEKCRRVTLDNEREQNMHATSGTCAEAPDSRPIDQLSSMEEICEVPQEPPVSGLIDQLSSMEEICEVPQETPVSGPIDQLSSMEENYEVPQEAPVSGLIDKLSSMEEICEVPQEAPVSGPTDQLSSMEEIREVPQEAPVFGLTDQLSSMEEIHEVPQEAPVSGPIDELSSMEEIREVPQEGPVSGPIDQLSSMEEIREVPQEAPVSGPTDQLSSMEEIREVPQEAPVSGPIDQEEIREVPQEAPVSGPIDQLSSMKEICDVPQEVPVSGPIYQLSSEEEIHDVPQEAPATEDMDTGGAICSSQINTELENACYTTTLSKCIEREGNKRKRVVEHLMEGQNSCNGFIKSPCEGLRPRTGRVLSSGGGTEGNEATEKKTATKKVKRDGSVPFQENNIKRAHRCDLEGCRMSFKTRAELLMHKRNRCPEEGCGKWFSSHRYAMLHQKVHNDDRPLKCPWKGCKMSFKWAWARTEHLRVHTGERPYQCEVAGCGRTFRFVSDFSRHRRKTGHYVNVTTS